MKKLLALLLTAALCAGLCSVSVAEAPAKTAMVPGTYEGSAQGMNDVLTVSVTVTEDKIEDVQVTAHQETPGIGAPLGYGTDGAEGDTPIAVIPSRIVENQSITVDSVTGATITSYAVMGAVKDALTKAGANTAEWQIKAEKAAPEAFEETADVVVLGGGGAGLAAAISALENGAESVIIVEKCGAVGGDTLVCGAIYNCPDEELQSKGTMTEAQHNTIKAAIEREAVSDDHKALQETVAAELKAYEEAGRTDIFDSDAWYALQTYDGGPAACETEYVKFRLLSGF